MVTQPSIKALADKVMKFMGEVLPAIHCTNIKSTAIMLQVGSHSYSCSSNLSSL